jgi:hypothetical protein
VQSRVGADINELGDARLGQISDSPAQELPVGCGTDRQIRHQRGPVRSCGTVDLEVVQSAEECIINPRWTRCVHVDVLWRPFRPLHTS